MTDRIPALKNPWVRPSSFGGKVLFWSPRLADEWLRIGICTFARLPGLATRLSNEEPTRDPQILRHHDIARLLRQLGVSSEKRILDVGCGAGGLLLNLLRAAYGYSDLSGCDWERSDAGEYSFPFELVNLNSETFPYSETTFGVVICNQVPEHLENPAAVLREISRVLVSEGLAVITVPNPPNLFERISIVLLGESRRYGMVSRGVFGHITWLTDRILQSLLLRVGLAFEGYGRGYVMWGDHFLLAQLRVGPFCSYERILVARKSTSLLSQWFAS